MSGKLTPALLALAFVCAAVTPAPAIRSKKEETNAPKKSAEALATDALNGGLTKLASADRMETANPKDARKAYEAALKDLQTAVSHAPDNYKAHSGIGYAYRKLGHFDRALESYDRALALAPSYTEAIEYRAEAYLGLNRIEDAKRAYMQLFVADRTTSNVLMKVMKAWIVKRKAAPAGIDASALAAFETWVQERDTLAASVGNLGHNSPDWK